MSQPAQLPPSQLITMYARNIIWNMGRLRGRILRGLCCTASQRERMGVRAVREDGSRYGQLLIATPRHMARAFGYCNRRYHGADPVGEPWIDGDPELSDMQLQWWRMGVRS